eukprot:scaffold140857_cov31-Tisochrysis_lutea.AAC.4
MALRPAYTECGRESPAAIAAHGSDSKFRGISCRMLQEPVWDKQLGDGVDRFKTRRIAMIRARWLSYGERGQGAGTSGAHAKESPTLSPAKKQDPSNPSARSKPTEAKARSYPFTIGSGMRDAGCSKDARYRSPLTFLLTTEALTRAINGDTDIEGLISTDNGRYNLKINPFADDTALITRDYASLKQALQWMKAHENAT